MSPIDNLNLNRVFLGRPKGSFMERLAWSLVQRAMRHASIYIDLHGGDLAEALVPFALCQQTGNPAVDAQSPRMATAFGSSSLTEQHPSAAPITGPAVAAAARLRIRAIIAEDGGASLYAPAVAARMPAGLENVLRTLMFWTALCRIFRRRAASPNSSGSDSHAAGFFKQSVQVGDDTEAGTPVGVICDFFGTVIETVTAPAGGKVLFLVISPAIARDGLVCGIARNGDPEPG